jgi:hypothetical protein
MLARNMYPNKRIKRRKCQHQMRKKVRPLLDLDSVPSTQLNKILMRCEGLKHGGPREDRLTKYDKCLRNSVEDVAPETTTLPPKLAIKPYILLDSSNCQDLPGNASDALNTYKIKLKEYLENHVRGIVFIKSKFIKEFWCANKALYFKLIQKKHVIDRKFYTVMLELEPKNNSNLDLRYELYDIKTSGFLYSGRVNSKPFNSSQAPSEIFNSIKNARNQVLQQIIKYDPSN